MFDIDSYPYRLALIEKYKGQSGIACVYKISTSNKYDDEEQLIACAKTDSGEKLPEDFIFKLLELDCIKDLNVKLQSIEEEFKNDFDRQLINYKAQVDDRTNVYVDYEINKYELWADDQLHPLRKEVEDLSKECDVLRRQIRKEHNAASKVQLKKRGE